MTEQMKALRISIPYTFFQGYTPASSKDYIIDRDARSPEKDTMMCCMRSHAGALHQFVTEFPESRYALIIEDDAALITNFETELNALVKRWQDHADDIDYVSLGYFPSKGPHTSAKRDRSLLWKLTSMVWGTQAYIVKRSAAVKMAQILHHPTSKALRSAFTQYIKTELSGVPCTNKHPVIQPDAMIPIGWKQAVAFPLLVIELPINSTITAADNHVSMGLWEPVFTNGGRTKDEFYSIPTSPRQTGARPAAKPSAISILKSLTLSEAVLPHPVAAKRRRLIVCADNRSPYEGADAYWTYCIMMNDAYSKLIGVDFKFELLKETERHPAWEKIRVVQKYVDFYDEIMWFDSDATVINNSVNVFDYIKTAPESEWKRDASKKPVLYALSDKPFVNDSACSGIFMVDCSDKVLAHKVLTEWWNDLDDKAYQTKHPWEQRVWRFAWKDTPKASYIRVADVYSMVVKDPNQVFFHAANAYKNARLSVVKKYFYKQLYAKRAKRVGILVRQQNYYTNGCGQNCIFILQSLEALGYEVDLLINYKAGKPEFVSDTIQLSYTNIASVQFSDYKAIIFGSELPFKADNDRMKVAGVRRIMFNPCNVVDQFHNEHFLYKCHETPMPLQEMTYNDIADEVWIIESHKESTLTYMEVINKNKIPVVAIPHIWSPLFLQGADGSVPVNRPHTGKKMDIVIMEPNMGYCKSGWIPLIICEKIQLEHPDLINQVFFFGTPDSNPTAMGMIHSLDLWKSKKLRTMTRMPITDILAFFSDPKKHGEHPTVFLSHSVNSPLNYAYFDALYAGFPFVHNSPMLKERGIGYYYKGIADAVDAILSVPTSYSIEESVGKARTFLAIQDPYSLESVAAFKRVLELPNSAVRANQASELRGPLLTIIPTKKGDIPPTIEQKKPIKPINPINPIKRLIVCADNRSPYIGTDDYWTYCVMMTDAYSKLIGVDFKFELLKDTERHPSWEKIRVVQKYVDSYDEIMWLDSDATIMNRSVNAFDYIQTAPESEWKRDASKKPVLYALSGTPMAPEHVCAGIFMVDCRDKQRAHAVLTEWWNDITDKKYEQGHPWEQSVWNNCWINTPKGSYIKGVDVWSMVIKDANQVFLHMVASYRNARLPILKKYFYKFMHPNNLKRIGIVVKQQDYYGKGERCVFMMQSLETLGYQVDLLINPRQGKSMEVTETIRLPYTNIKSASFTDYKAIIFGTDSPSKEDMDRIKAAGVRRILFDPDVVCDADEIWTVSTDMKFLNTIPVYTVPHTWSPLFSRSIDGIVPLKKPHTGTKMDIVILEYGTGSSLTICEALHSKYPDSIHQVFLFGTPETNPIAMEMIHSLDLWKSRKLRTMARMPLYDVLTFFSDPKVHGDHPPVFLSDACFDALYAGFPLVHNSLMLKEQGVGHYYNDSTDAVEMIRNVPTATEARKFLATKDPYSMDNVAVIKRLLDQPTKGDALPAEGVIKHTVTYTPGAQRKGVSKVFVINLDRRADRYALFQKNHPSFSGSVARVSAVDGKQLKLTSDLVHLFRGNDFNWLKGIMGCALSHYNLWKQLADSPTDTSYLLFEDDVVCPPDFVEKVNHYIRHMPADTDVLYLGGVLPANKPLFDTVVEPVNDHIGRIKLRADTGTRFFHFGAYSYILTKRGAKALMDYIGEHGIYQAIDMILCRRYKTMNLYFSLPHLCTITQYNDPSFITSSFNDVANQNVYDSDIANTKDRFTEEDVRAASIQILVVSACDKRKAILEQQFKELEIPFPIRYLEAKVLDAEAPGYVPEGVTTIERRSILSTRSHIRAVELAGLDTSPPFTLILEDDVALHTTEFKSTLLQIMETYDAAVAPHSGVLSLGWIPCNNYSFYSQLANPSVPTASYTIHQRFTPGTQAYLIKRSKAAEFTSLFKHTTHRALCDAILAKKHPMITKESQIAVFDDFGTKLLEQCILFPPLVIEQPNTSLIRDTEENPYWAQFFKGHEDVRDRYWKVKPKSKFQDITKPLLITYDNKPTGATRLFQKTLENNQWEYVLIGEGEMWEGLQFSKRVMAYYNYIETLPDEKIVVLSDARDVLCVRGAAAFIDGFRSFGNDIVASMELSWNSKISVPSDYFPQDTSRMLQYWKHRGGPLPVRRYVNMGLVAGTVKALKHCLQWVSAAMKTSTVPECDQYSFAAYMNAFPERVAADKDAILLHTTNGGLNAGILNIHVQKEDFPTFAELFGRAAFFLHIPGSGGKNGQGVLYNQVCKGIELGMCDKVLREPYGYNEPTWNEVF